MVDYNREFLKNQGFRGATLPYVEEIPPLRHSKIVKALHDPGTQADGIFFMDNDHIVKTFREGYMEQSTGVDDLAWYKKIYDAQFSGQGTLDEPMIYDLGTTGKNPKALKYVEMGRIIPLPDWFSLSGRTKHITNELYWVTGDTCPEN